ncbi:uncharacterized protein PRCAT00004194001 [Priceomyces carsonii]|uniref:uncharacterized protein n=1 Tax=Priceomyces carsonii TaxID=28549 RepID=UPI002ED954DB|nr:unnamed protein product [Priceomyces carsonii]
MQDSSGTTSDLQEEPYDSSLEETSQTESFLTTSDDFSEDSDEDINVDESLSTTIIKEIEDGTYTCLVCTGEIDRDCEVWSCQECFRVYDLDCIKAWALRGSSTDKTNKTWRCPSCNTAISQIPKKFSCWCGKVNNPEKDSVIPFSCGNPCTFKHEDCIHSCSSICHPGNHPTCGAMGPIMKCHCGLEERQLPCLITPYSDGWRCDNECSVSLCAFGHRCPRACHLGFCGPCQKQTTAKCYCGKEDLLLECNELRPEKCLDWIGVGQCSNKSTIYYDCGLHFETVPCQPQNKDVKECRYSPLKVTTCYCGNNKVSLEHRTKCTDPIPECDSVCGKPLECGCKCLMKCHAGPCICFNIIETPCSCENYSFLVPCKFLQSGMKPKCTHKCSVLLNCRKHYHKEVCCAFEKHGLKRERSKKKALRNNIRATFDDELMSIEPVHICTRPCNRLKSCKIHYCEALCHSGSCGVCLESSNEDLVCHCGKTVIEAPVRCGTKLVCHEQCNREKECGHRTEIHECHDDSVSCPKCTATVKKQCNCGKKSDIPNILCSQTNVSCGNICKEQRDCGHLCLRVCSSKCTKDNDHATSKTCQSMCHKRRLNCPHFCSLRCHSNKQDMPKNCDQVSCKDPVKISCNCGHLTKTVPCGASINETSKICTVLSCTEECAKALREEQLKEAFDSSGESSSQTKYPDLVLTTYERQTRWCSIIENVMRNFVSSYLTLNGSTKSSYHFNSMSKPQRAFVHELAATYKLYSESQDKEPQRSVFIVITPRTKLTELTINEAISMKRKNNLSINVETIDIPIDDENFFNAILIENLFFGVVREEIEDELQKLTATYKFNDSTLQWMQEGKFVLYSPGKYKTITVEEENELYLMMKAAKRALRDKSLAFDCKLCMVDDDLNYILKTEGTKIDKQKLPSSRGTPVEPQNSFQVLEVAGFE